MPDMRSIEANKIPASDGKMKNSKASPIEKTPQIKIPPQKSFIILFHCFSKISFLFHMF